MSFHHGGPRYIPFGTVLGELTALDPAPKDSNNRAMQWAVCTCGTVKELRLDSFKTRIRSCGNCGWKTKFPSEYKSWEGMNSRCYNTNHPKYKDYGGRGITVCMEWRNSFARFLNDVGPKPFESYTIDRNNNNGNYEPNNCSWESKRQQALNRGRN